MTDQVASIVEQWRRERPDLDPSPMALIGRLHRVGHHLQREIDRVHREHGLAEGEFDVLATLRRAGAPYELTPSGLASATMVTTGAMTKRIDRLEKAGLVKRERADHDGRGRIIALTQAGLERIERAVEAHLENEQQLLEPLSPSARAELTSLLTRWSEEIEGQSH